MLALLVAVLVALVLLVALFPWNLLREPINRYVSDKTGREFRITRHLDVKVGRTTRVIMDGVEFANPDWAVDRHLVKAERAEIEVRLLPLLRREIVLPSVTLSKPQLGLQQEPDGRRTWALGEDTNDESNVPYVGALIVDEGMAHYVASDEGADITARFAIDPNERGTGQAGAMPLRFQAEGRWQKQAFRAEGRTGDVLYLSAPLQQPFPAEVKASTGGTTLQARGAIASLSTLDGANVNFQLQGPNLAELYKLVGVVLPDTPRYSVAGQLSKQGAAWRVRDVNGRLGSSDVSGELAFDQSGQLPLLTGRLQSRTLDFVDLAPLIGLDDERRGTEGRRQAPVVAQADGRKPPKDPQRKVLPGAPVDVSRLKSMNADVHVQAARIVNAKGLPLDRMSAHVVLKDGVLTLQPLDLGVAGGQLAGQLRIDANAQPVLLQTRLDARGLELQRLLPRTESARSSFGKLQGQVDLTARGASVAQMLATSDGSLALLMGRGQISNILLEIAGLDGGEVIKFLLGGDRRVDVRCAAFAFNIEKGLAQSRALLLDTEDTVFNGDARINLAQESMDVVVRPRPKDASILSLRTPLHVGGTFGAPEAGLDTGALAGRAGLAVALGAINPLLALAATIETGPGQDADCAGTLREASAPRAEAQVQRTAPPAKDDRRAMGAAGNGSASRAAAPQQPAAPVAPAARKDDAPRAAAAQKPIEGP